MSTQQPAARAQPTHDIGRSVQGPFGRTRIEIERLAMHEGPWPMTDDHWRVIQFVRAFYRDSGRAPALVRVARATGYRLAHLERLFPDGVVRTVFRMTGLDLPLDLRTSCPFYCG